MDNKPSQQETLISKDFVFKKNSDGTLAFVGDFEGLYREEKDPWGQSGTNPRLGEYYIHSRSNLAKHLKSISEDFNHPIRVLEVGSGLGFVTDYLQNELRDIIQIVGIDVSAIAVEKAKSNFPRLEFRTGDICSKYFQFDSTPYDVVIMSQILWYILEGLPQALNNISKLMSAKGSRFL